MFSINGCSYNGENNGKKPRHYPLNKNICIRKSCRHFSDRKIENEVVEKIIRAGMLAPSGKNGQPWKFAVVQNDKALLKQISALTIYNNFVSEADCLIAIYLDKRQSYHYFKDVQCIGACIENMLLQATAYKIGNCWLGEILNRSGEVNNLLDIDSEKFELMAVIALGYSISKTQQPKKKKLEECLLKSM